MAWSICARWRCALPGARTYICEAESWGSCPYDYLSLGLCYTGGREGA